MTQVSRTQDKYDVVVVGAGPAGAAAAVGFARTGASVLLLEANPKAATRFAGEWVHPTGAAILERLGLAPTEATARHRPCEGFVVFPDDGSDPIRLEYVGGALGFTCHHGALVSELRAKAAATPGVEYLEHARLTELDGDRLTIQLKGAPAVEVRAGRVVGADGRSSVVRKSLFGEREADLVGHMAGLELEGVELPVEGYGQVLLGGPGPVLLYRIGENTVRACVDLPDGHPGSRRDARYLWEAFGPRFPATLRGAFRHALETQRLVWASNRFVPRTLYGAGDAGLVGDAVGFYHPLTASGITIGLKDAEALVSAPDIAAYQEAREPMSYLPELLANALHQVFTREDEAAASVRSAVYSVWRGSALERERTMRFLGGDDVPIREFGRSFLRVAGEAVQATVQGAGPSKLPAFLEFAQWPIASFTPHSIRRRIREKGSSLQPLRGIGLTPRAFELPDAPTPAPADVDVDALIARVSDREMAETSVAPLRRAVSEKHAFTAVRMAAEAVAASLTSLHTDVASAHPRVLALADAAAAHPGLLRGPVRDALLNIQVQVLELADTHGRYRDTRTTALALEVLGATGLPIFHPAMRRVARALASAQRDDGSFGDARTTACAARAILRTSAPFTDAAEVALASLASEEQALPYEAGDALRLYRDARSTRLAPAKQRRRSERPVGASAEDHAYCFEALLAVSRSFARPIEMLPGDLKTAVMCGYLLCRIADTIEDNPHFTTQERDLRYQLFLDALDAQPQAECTRAFERAFEGVQGNEVENQLARRLSTVMRVYRSIPVAMQTKASRWVAEMVRGMQLYSHRAPGHDGWTSIHTPEDLERYCYFVAGTVGFMLTDLFVEAFGEDGGELELALREKAEAFGVGLQFVNILKDVTDDRERQVSFIPRTSCARQGIDIKTLVDPDLRDRAHAAVAPLFERAQDRLDHALEYTLTIPADQPAVRLFCLLPLFMAVRTLVLARGNDAMFIAGAPVKIPRAEVEQLIADCVANAGDDHALRTRYDALWRAPALDTPAPRAPLS